MLCGVLGAVRWRGDPWEQGHHPCCPAPLTCQEPSRWKMPLALGAAVGDVKPGLGTIWAGNHPVPSNISTAAPSLLLWKCQCTLLIAPVWGATRKRATLLRICVIAFSNELGFFSLFFVLSSSFFFFSFFFSPWSLRFRLLCSVLKATSLPVDFRAMKKAELYCLDYK